MLDQMRITFRYDDFPNMLFHVVERHCDEDDSPAKEEQHFAIDENAVNDMKIENNDNDEKELPTLSGDLIEDINRARGEGFLVDDENELLVENAPTNNSNDEECACGN